MDSDPTKYPGKPPIEPTEPISTGSLNPYANITPYYINPYEHTEPYYRDLPSIPPPPPKQSNKKRRRNVLLAWVISVVGLVLIGLIVFYGVTGLPWQSKQTAQITATATHISPAVVKHYTAYQIVNKINGAFNIQNTSDSSNVSGNTGMVQFEFSIPANGPVDLFLGTYETNEEAISAMNYYEATFDGPGAVYQYNYCMMIYGPMPAHILANVIQQVNEYCV